MCGSFRDTGIWRKTIITCIMKNCEINIPDVALIIEGGGMRASYTAGAIVTMLEREMNFGKVYGISAGSSHTVNYLSRDIARTKAAFVDIVKDPDFGGVGSFLRGTGYFNAPHLYEGLVEDYAGTDEVMAYDWGTFCANPADFHIEAFDWETGETVAWTRKDVQTPRDLLLRVRASSSMPIFMPPVTFGGRTYLDGGMGESWGICLRAAQRDGFKRFFIVRTQERGYRKKPVGVFEAALMRAVFGKHPLVAERTIERWRHYNALLDEIDALEVSGAAYVFYPEKMDVTNKTADLAKLQAAYNRGYAQAQREADAWEKWLRG